MCDGLFLLNKPQGVSSRGYGLELKRKLALDKVGHAGTLDLEATGLLLVLSGRALKLQNYLLDGSKIYSGTILLGQTSDTDDIHGNCIIHPEAGSKLVELNSNDTLERIIREFSPKYSQKPSLVSSKKVNGVSSRILVKQGLIPDLKETEVEVDFEELRFISKTELYYRVKVSKGFYVRALARDIGEFLGVGGIAKSINRDAVFPYILTEAIGLEEYSSSESLTVDMLGSAYKSLNQLASNLPYTKVILKDEAEVKAFRSGNKAILEVLSSQIELLAEIPKMYSVVSWDEEYIGMVSVDKINSSFKFVF